MGIQVDDRMVSLAQLQEIPARNMILLVGPPGSGKSTFCQHSVLQNLSMDKPVIYVTTEYGPSEARKTLKEKGLTEVEPRRLYFIDSYNETVGLSVSDRMDTVLADCEDLSSISIAISKLQERMSSFFRRAFGSFDERQFLNPTGGLRISVCLQNFNRWVE